MIKNTTALSSWSGGKDSCLACYHALKQGYEIKHLLNFISRDSKRGCFHGLEGRLLKEQARKIGIPLIQHEVSPDMRLYEQEFKEAVALLVSRGFQSMVFGDIYLLDHASWVDRVCAEIGIHPVEPLWNKSPRSLIEDFLSAGFKAVIVSCKADVMGGEYVGREISMPLIDELEKKGVCPCGENGEYHTVVTDGPLFSEPLRILKSRPVLIDGFWKHWFLDIKEFS